MKGNCSGLHVQYECKARAIAPTPKLPNASCLMSVQSLSPTPSFPCKPPPLRHSRVEPSPPLRHSRAGGNLCLGLKAALDSRLRGNDGNRRQALRGNDGNRRQALRGNNGNRRQALRGNDGNRRQALRGNDGNRRQARRKNDRVKALLPVQRVNTVLTARIKPIFLYFLRLLRSFCALCVLPPYPPPHSLPRSLCQPRFVACELLLHLGGCCAAQGVAGVE